MRKYLSLYLLLFLATFTFAQDNNPNRTSAVINGNLQVGIPLDEFADNLDALGFGAGGLLAFRIKNSPIYAGIELSGMIYDSQTDRYSVNIGGFIEEYDLRTSNSIFLGHFLLRIMPDIDFPVKPYIDGMIGTKNLYTRTKLIDINDVEPDEQSRIEEGDWAFSYGGAFGLQISISKKDNAFLDLRCAYLPGTNASYLVRREADETVSYEEPIDAFERKNSATLLLMPQIGVTFTIGSSDME